MSTVSMTSDRILRACALALGNRDVVARIARAHRGEHTLCVKSEASAMLAHAVNIDAQYWSIPEDRDIAIAHLRVLAS